MTHPTTLAAGIDTAKDKLDVAFHPGATRLSVENRPSGYKRLVIELPHDSSHPRRRRLLEPGLQRILLATAERCHHKHA